MVVNGISAKLQFSNLLSFLFFFEWFSSWKFWLVTWISWTGEGKHRTTIRWEDGIKQLQDYSLPILFRLIYIYIIIMRTLFPHLVVFTFSQFAQKCSTHRESSELGFSSWTVVNYCCAQGKLNRTRQSPLHCVREVINVINKTMAFINLVRIRLKQKQQYLCCLPKSTVLFCLRLITHLVLLYLLS